MSHREFKVHLVEKDYIAYNQFTVRRVNKTKAGYKITRLMGIFLILLGALVCYLQPNYFILMLPIFLLGFLYGFGLDWFMKVMVKRNLKNMLSQGRSDTLLGDFTYVINHEGFERKSNLGYGGTYWHAFDCIEETEDHLFIFNSSITAYIVPKRELTETEFEELKSLVDQYFNEANESQ